MRVAFDISSIQSENSIHKNRGIGFYVQNLKDTLLKNDLENTYFFFSRKQQLQKDIDIIHYPTFDPFFLTLPLVNKYKTVVTVHDLIPLVFPNHFPVGMRGKIKWSIQKYVLSKENAIITDSQCSKQDIIKFTGIKEEKIFVVYLAPADSYKKVTLSDRQISELKNKYKLPKQFILYVGDVTWNKNLPRLLKAVAKVDIPLVMVGKALVSESYNHLHPWNKDLYQVQQMAKSNTKVMRLGFVPTDELVAIYNIADVFVMPSLYEGFGLPVLEAMSCGCPVITSKQGSLGEITENACVYIDPYNETDIANAIKKILSSKDIQTELSQKGIVQAKKFTWEQTARETINVYRRILT